MKTVKLTKEKLKLFIKEELDKLEEVESMEEVTPGFSPEEMEKARKAEEVLQNKIAALQSMLNDLSFAVQDGDRIRLTKILSGIFGNQ